MRFYYGTVQAQAAHRHYGFAGVGVALDAAIACAAGRARQPRGILRQRALFLVRRARARHDGGGQQQPRPR